MSGYFSLADGRCVPVRDGFTIGRAVECDLAIDDGKASRRHARVIIEAGVVEIEDLGSSNGTLLNGKAVARRLLRDGDMVQIGKSVFTYREGLGAKAAAVASGPVSGKPTQTADDNDLFGDDVRSPPAPPAPPAARPGNPVASPPSAPSMPAAPKKAVVEFADEIVEVQKTVAKAPGAPSGASAGAETTIQKQQRVLQFSQHKRGQHSVLGDDLSQVSGSQRSLIYAAVLAVAVGLAWLCVWLVR